MRVTFDLDSVESYRQFLAVKSLPTYRIVGRTGEFPDEYAGRLGMGSRASDPGEYVPILGLFDYQEAIARLAIRKRKFAAFVDMGLGKTLIMLEFARHAARQIPDGQAILIVSPLMVVEQTIAEARAFYGDTLPIEQIRAADLAAWMTDPDGGRIGITNYEGIHAGIPRGRIGGLILDESAMLKSHYGKWGADCIRLGKGLDWKLCLTGTPAPNDRIEYANHAVFLDAFPNVNSFLAKFFVNRGQTNERWELKPHALRPFYRALSHWSIFLTNPATYGWKDNTATIPPIHVHIHDVEMSDSQNAQVRALTGTMFPDHVGGIGDRSKLARIAKTGDTRKPAFIRELIASWPDESTLVWCRFNDEQDRLASELPGAASIAGATPYEERRRIIDDFKAGRIRTLVSKPRILGLGLNLQVATRQVFSSCHDSFEEYVQAVKRSNRVGSTRPLNVHLPVSEVERPMMENVLRKAKRVEHDTREQEEMFRDASL